MRTRCAKIWLRANSPLVVVASRVVNAACGLLTAPVLARSLGTDGRGYAAAILAILTVVPIGLALGVPLAVRRRASVGQPQSGLIRAGLFFSILTTPVAVAVGLGFNLVLFADLQADVKWWFLIAAATAPLTVTSNVLASILVVRHEYRRLAAVYCTQLVVFTLVLLALWTTGRLALSSVPAAYAVGAIVTAVVALRWVHPTGKEPAPVIAVTREGLSLVGSQIADIASQRLDQILIIPLVGAATAGIYSVAVTVGSIPMAFAFGLNAATFPEVSRETDTGRPAVGRSVRYATVLAAFISLALAVASPWAIPAVFGSAFEPSVPVALISLVGSVALVVGYTASMCLIAMQRGNGASMAQGLGLAMGIGLLWPLAGAFGAAGAALASGVGYTTTLVVALILLSRLGALKYARPRRTDVLAAWKYMIAVVR